LERKRTLTVCSRLSGEVKEETEEMRMNRVAEEVRTAEGGKGRRISPKEELERTVMACLLWEKGFYEDGEGVAERIRRLVGEVGAEEVAQIAVEARKVSKLRHVPLLLTRELARIGKLKKETLAEVIQRPDELAEFLAIYWMDGRQPLAGQVKKGLAMAFRKFGAYQLAKWNRDGAVKLRDVLFLCHAKPDGLAQEELWKGLVSGSLPVPDTWEVALSAGKDKKETWGRLMVEKKLGALAFLRNLRNMQEVKVPGIWMREYLREVSVKDVLPFRFIAAARFAPWLEEGLEKKMWESLEGEWKWKGTTVVLVDVSGSMEDQLSERSDMKRLDAACGVAMLVRELAEEVRVFSFSLKCVEVAGRRGFGLRDAIMRSQDHASTYLAGAMEQINKLVKYQRIVVITDEQSHDGIAEPTGQGYLVNVASNRVGVGYRGRWEHVDGWSEGVVKWIGKRVEEEGRKRDDKD
jgi:60 kDa SS-A/Ro ribonucleoprotein